MAEAENHVRIIIVVSFCRVSETSLREILPKTPPIMSEILVFEIEYKNAVTESNCLRSHGLVWRLMFSQKSYNGRSYTSLSLSCIDAKIGEIDSVHAHVEVTTTEFRTEAEDYIFSRDSPRKILFQKCTNGPTRTFQIEVAIRVDAEKTTTWKSTLTLGQQLFKLSESQTGTDVTFVVGGHRIGAHRIILIARGSCFAELMQDLSDGVSEVPLDGEDPRLFEILLRYLYTESLPSDFDYQADAIPMLKIADKYSIVDLKMAMEAHIVKDKSIFTKDSAVDLLLLAHSHTCALLQEAATKLLSARIPAIIGTDDWNNLAKSPELLGEVVRHQAVRNMKSVDANANILDSLNVGSLRVRAAKRGLEVDGSRDALVKRLKGLETDSSSSS